VTTKKRMVRLLSADSKIHTHAARVWSLGPNASVQHSILCRGVVLQITSASRVAKVAPAAAGLDPCKHTGNPKQKHTKFVCKSNGSGSTYVSFRLFDFEAPVSALDVASQGSVLLSDTGAFVSEIFALMEVSSFGDVSPCGQQAPILLFGPDPNQIIVPSTQTLLRSPTNPQGHVAVAGSVHFSPSNVQPLGPWCRRTASAARPAGQTMFFAVFRPSLRI
jgi:hypothetical protein